MTAVGSHIYEACQTLGPACLSTQIPSAIPCNALGVPILNYWWRATRAQISLAAFRIARLDPETSFDRCGNNALCIPVPAPDQAGPLTNQAPTRPFTNAPHRGAPFYFVVAKESSPTLLAETLACTETPIITLYCPFRCALWALEFASAGVATRGANTNTLFVAPRRWGTIVAAAVNCTDAIWVVLLCTTGTGSFSSNSPPNVTSAYANTVAHPMFLATVILFTVSVAASSLRFQVRTGWRWIPLGGTLIAYSAPPSSSASATFWDAMVIKFTCSVTSAIHWSCAMA